jgi:hypothetical protein
MATILYPDATLIVDDSATPTFNTTIAKGGVTVSGSSFGALFTNTSTASKITVIRDDETKSTEITPASVVLDNVVSGVHSTLSNNFSQSPYVTMTAESVNDPPDFPSQICSLSTAGLVANNSFGWDLDVAKLKLHGNLSTEGQVITSDANGRPIWATLPSGSTPNLADVLAVATAGDADQQTISNLLSVAVENTSSASAIVMSQTADGQLDLTSSTPADLLDITLATKQFNGNYLKLSIGGTVYYFQAFSVPPP